MKFEIDLNKKQDISEIENLSELTELILINYKMEVVFKNKEEYFDGNLFLTRLEKKKVYRNLKKLHLNAWTVNINGERIRYDPVLGEKTLKSENEGRYFANVFHQLNTYFPNIEELIIENFRVPVSVASLYLFKKVKTVEIVRNYTKLDMEFLDKKNSIKLLKLTDSRSTYSLEDIFKLKKIFNVELRPKLSKAGEKKLKEMEDSEVSVRQLEVKYWTEDIQRVKKILSDPKSISLEYTYKGETLKGDSSIPHGKGEKQFIEPESFKELEEIVVDGMLIPMTYDLEFLKCLKGDVAKAFFYNYETRISEHGYYVNGKLHGPSQVYFGSIPSDDALYLLICKFHEGAPDGFGFFRGVGDQNYDEMRVIRFSKGSILKIYSIEWDDEKRNEWNSFFKNYSKDLWKLLNQHI